GDPALEAEDRVAQVYASPDAVLRAGFRQRGHEVKRRHGNAVQRGRQPFLEAQDEGIGPVRGLGWRGGIDERVVGWVLPRVEGLAAPDGGAQQALIDRVAPSLRGHVEAVSR